MDGATWPVISQSNNIRIAAKLLLHAGRPVGLLERHIRPSARSRRLEVEREAKGDTPAGEKD